MALHTFHHHLHAFRGFAILNIVAAHCWTILITVATHNDNSNDFLPLYATSETLFHNATIYFAIISGLLFSLVLKKYSWKKFYLSKLKNVLAPYIIFSTIYGLISGMLIVEPDSTALTFSQAISTLPMHIIAGSSFAHMWYIPVLIVLFLLTPLFKVILTTKKLFPIWVLIVLAPLIFSRSWPDFVWQNFVFFFGPYILGMLVGNHYQQAQLIIQKYRAWLTSVAIISTGILMHLYLIELETIQGVKLQESVGYIQKLSIGFVVLNFMQRHESQSPKILHTLGDYSFSIYFVHMFFAAMLGFIMVAINLTPPTLLGIFLSGFVLLPFTILVSVGFTWLIKKVMGQYSRYLIGS